MNDGQRSMNDEQQATDLILRHKLEIQVGSSGTGWQLRVRGYDPVGTIHEDSFGPTITALGPTTLSKAIAISLQMFCLRYGLPI